jgi:hypothetical protein
MTVAESASYLEGSLAGRLPTPGAEVASKERRF